MKILESIFINASITEQHWLEGILYRFLRVGVSQQIINTVWPDLIPDLGLTIYSKFEMLEQVSVPAYIQPLIDGTRLGINIYKGKAVAISDGYRPCQFIDDILEQLESSVSEDILLDGILHFKNPHFDFLNCKVKSIPCKLYKELVSNYVFYVYDYVSPDIFFQKYDYTDKTPLIKRKALIDKLIKKLPKNSNIKAVEYKIAETRGSILTQKFTCQPRSNGILNKVYQLSLCK